MKSIAPLIASVVVSVSALAQTAAPVQSSARPFGLPIAGQVMLAGSDAASATFQNTELPGLNQYLNSVLGEGQSFNTGNYLLDPSKLFLKTDANVRAYFIGEGAGYQNTLGLFTVGGLWVARRRKAAKA